MSSPERQDFDTGELDHEFAASALDLSEERGSSALETDPEQRRWLRLGLGGAAIVVVITVAIVFGKRSDAADVVEDPAPEPSAAVVEPVGEPAASDSTTAGQPDSTKAGELAPTRRGRAQAHVASGPKAGSPPAGSGVSKPAGSGASKPGDTGASSPASTPSADSPPAVVPAPDDDEPAGDGGELPNVEPWDEVDDEARREQIEAPKGADDEPGLPELGAS